MLKKLCTKGYLPRELPPIFSSATLSKIIGKALPDPFINKKANWTQPVSHNLARPGGLRRKLTVPNPVNFFRLARAFDNNATLLKKEWANSPFSRTSPRLIGERALSNHATDRATSRASIRVGARYLVRTDISQFYPSIYTHSIPWALHTKSVAKAKIRDDNLAGNVLDWELQACQLGQTKGVAIGPDTSLGIAELLLARVDRELYSQCNIIGGVRFIDDMEFTFRNLSDAEGALAKLEGLLSQIELQLNPKKTQIVELPDEIESTYVTLLRSRIPNSTTASRSKWIDYFNLAFVTSKNHSDGGVLRYAVAALQGVVSSPKNWLLVQELLWQCISADPGSLPFVIDVMLIHRSQGLQIDRSIGSAAINSLIQSSAPVAHGGEVVWSIWAAMVLNLRINRKSRSAITKMDDSLVASAAHLAKARGLFPDDFESDLWASWLVEDSFNQENWLFAYESMRHGWYATQIKTSKIKSDVSARFLSSNGVSFLDSTIVDSYTPKRISTTRGAFTMAGY